MTVTQFKERLLSADNVLLDGESIGDLKFTEFGESGHGDEEKEIKLIAIDFTYLLGSHEDEDISYTIDLAELEGSGVDQQLLSFEDFYRRDGFLLRLIK